MRQKSDTFATYVAIICFILGIVALTQAVITESSEFNSPLSKVLTIRDKKV